MLLKEVCVENFTNIPAALARGANRVELCDNLTVGGTTVSTGVMEETMHYCSEKSIPVMAIIRPRGGNFVFHDTELKIMRTDLIEAKKLGVDGVVLGCLTSDNWIDEDAMEELLEIAAGLQITFHMAFDAIPEAKQFAAIDWLVEHSVQRILTHGGTSEEPIETHLPHLKKLVDYAGKRIIILPGGGIHSENAEFIATELGVNEVHGTKIVGTF
ncbi:copper homeostasis protein CutC [Carnobacterium gallinarum]|uniref:copper homeostasis protein CutC n=1 Tax=Carnobacterium gallinarum TaxID=2749 RepID=UPI000551505B|nr:copper homeostasis protein CutC [Carnobacterium gallinarum]